MRQLEQILGADELRDGLREYLARFAFSNATWTDLIGILDRRTKEDLAAWSRAWVDEPGRPTIATHLETANGKVSRLELIQSDPRGRSLRWVQQLNVALGYGNGARITSLKMDGPSAEVPRVQDLPLPHYVLANGEGTGYGLFALDDRSRQYFLGHLHEIGDGLTRGIAWVTCGTTCSKAILNRRGFSTSRCVHCRRSATSGTSSACWRTRTMCWRYLNDADRATWRPASNRHCGPAS
jgi:aminopeptidase N